MSQKQQKPPLVETTAPLFCVHRIIERVQTPVGDCLRAEGLFGAIGVRNENNREYPESVWDAQLKEDSVLMRRIASRLALGELEHPESGITHLARVSHVVEKVWKMGLKEGNEYGVPVGRYIIGQYMILPTPNGRILEALHACGIPVGVSSRGRGDLAPNNEGVDVVQDNYECETWDCVYSPSVAGAYPRPALAPPKGKPLRAEATEALALVEGQSPPDRLALVVAGSKMATLIERLAKADSAEDKALLEKLKAGRQRILGRLLERSAVTKEPKPKKGRQAVDETKKRTARLLAEMASRTLAAEAKAAEAGKPKPKIEEAAPAAAPKPGEKKPPVVNEKVAALEKRLQMTDELATAFLERARAEKTNHLRLEKRCAYLSKISESLIARGRQMKRRLAVLEKSGRTAGPGSVRTRQQVSEATAVVGVKDPAEGRQPKDVAPSQPQTLIGGLAARGM